MANAVVLGMQWGDEGKGKIVDLICPAFDAVVRYQGGNNAGHTVKFADRHYALHLIPSGILHPGLACVLGNGMVVNPEAFLAEVERLEESGVDTAGRLFVSSRAHALLGTHILLDRRREEAAGAKAIGTTARGIGPAYETKASRHGLRLCDLFGDHFEERLRSQLARIRAELADLGGEAVEPPEAVARRCREWLGRLRPYLRDTTHLLLGWIDEGKNILFEGAQGTLLDIDHGTYPYVSSSSSSAGGVCTGTGIPPKAIDGVIGVLKAYTTRVGGGPMATEAEEQRADHLRQRGNEYGTTTGRPRRCGWLDIVAARYARRINGVEVIALTKLDVLDGLEEIRVCVAYRHRGTVLKELPPELEALEELEPVYKTVKGWRQETRGSLDFEELPQAAQEYVKLIEDEVGAPVGLLSVGARREETIVRPLPVLERLTSGRLA